MTGRRRRELRVLLVTGAYFPEISSGGLQCQAVAEALRGTVDFRVLTTAVDTTLSADDIVESVPVSRVRIDVKSRSSRRRALVTMLVQLLRLVPRMDVVHIHGFSQKNILVTAVAKLFGRPVVLSLHTAKHDEPDTIVAQGRLAWWAFRAADLYLSVSPRLIERYLAAGLSPQKIRQVANGVDLKRFSPATPGERRSVRQALGLPPDRPIILFVGTLSHVKQPRVLYDAWRRLQDDASLASTLLLVGATSSRYFEVDEQLVAEIRADVERAGCSDRVVFVQPTNQVHDYFRAADLFVLPSAREGLPVALLEAMATGLPSIASRLAGATDVIIDDGVNGLLVAPGDVAALTGALRELLGDRARATAIGVAGRERVARDYSVEQTAKRWLQAYRELNPLAA